MMMNNDFEIACNAAEREFQARLSSLRHDFRTGKTGNQEMIDQLLKDMHALARAVSEALKATGARPRLGSDT
jgi:tellurite resistance protein